MQLYHAIKEAKELNSKNSSMNAAISKSVYGGYSVSSEPIELTIIKNSISMLVAKDRKFMSNVGAKYGK